MASANSVIDLKYVVGVQKNSSGLSGLLAAQQRSQASPSLPRLYHPSLPLTSPITTPPRNETAQNEIWREHCRKEDGIFRTPAPFRIDAKVGFPDALAREHQAELPSWQGGAAAAAAAAAVAL